MPERVAVGRIVVGQDKDRKVIKPGQRFNTDEYGVDADTLKRWDERRVTREPRDQSKEEGEDSPRARSKRGEVVEGRSGPAKDVTNPTPGEKDENARVLVEPTDNRHLMPQGSQGKAQETQNPPPAPVDTGETSSRRRRSDADL